MGEVDYKCRICGAGEHSVILDYGKVALADSFLASLAEAEKEKKYQLTLVFCNRCSHLQIKEILDPKMLFENYVWETGIPASIRSYCQSFVKQVLEKFPLPHSASVVEIASNDGTLLQEFKAQGFNVLGVDPAKNIAQKAAARGIPTIADFFNLRIAQSILSDQGPADLCVGRNVMAHVADLHGLVGGIKVLLARAGVAVIEVPHLLTMFKELQYDQVFHEHIGYHSLDSVCKLAQMHGLAVVDVDQAWIHGGSLRIYLMHEGAVAKPSENMESLLAKEREAGILGYDAWREFAKRALEQKRLLREEIGAVKARGGVVAGYGASGKGQSLIQFCELDQALVSFIVDKSSMKIGKWTPGSHIPIYHPDHLGKSRLDMLILFAWNFAQEIIEQERELYKRVKFLHPIPVPHYL